MRKLILKMSISADGFVAGPKGQIDWIFRSMDESAAAWTVETLWQAGVHIMGSRTFHDMASYWPASSEVFAAPMNEIPKVVFTRKDFLEPTSEEPTTNALEDARINSEGLFNTSDTVSLHASSWVHAGIAGDSLETEINRLKEQDGKFILAHGGASFARSLVESGLIDEYRLLIHPVILGKGLPLFSTVATPFDLKLENSIAFKSGIIANTYIPLLR
ncbi:MAG: dihydrofolate reductase family protein [Paludibacter sp.]|nr:dihydrofolate reductase family protein [Paludibacter sp.]